MTTSKVIVTFGKTQVGKDTWIQLFLNVRTNPGQGFNSVTKYAEVYRGTINGTEYIVINLPGLDDSALRFDNDFVLQQIQVALVENNISQIDTVLLFESMNNDAHSLSRCYEQLRRLFGEKIQNTTLVVGNKLDISILLGDHERKKQLIGQQCQNLGLLHTFWRSFDRPNQALSENQRTQQNSEIIKKFTQLRPYSVNRVREIQEQLQQRAQQLMRTTPLQTQNTTFEYTEIEQIPYEEDETYEEEYDAVEPYEVTRNVKRIRVDQQTRTRQEIYYITERQIVGTKKVGGIGGLFKKKKTVYGDVEVPHTREVSEQIDVPVEYDAVETTTQYRTVKRKRTRQRTITKYRPQEVRKTKEEVVEIPHVPEEFLERVRREWIYEIRTQMQQVPPVEVPNHP